jgi:hypothetical protein
LIATKKVAPALAAGNCIVVKPSEIAPVAVIELARALHDAGLPPGVLNVVNGMGYQTGKALCEHPVIRKVDLTGGTTTGRAVAASAGQNLKYVTAELGGKAPVVSDCFPPFKTILFGVLWEIELVTLMLFFKLFAKCATSSCLPMPTFPALSTELHLAPLLRAGRLVYLQPVSLLKNRSWIR